MSLPVPAEKEVLPVPVIIERYLAGESIQVLAAESGKHRRTLYNWMLAEMGPEKYQELVTRCLVARIADADDELDNAKSKEAVSRASQTARFARMDFERRRPALYGAKPEQTQGGINIYVNRSLSDKPVEIAVAGQTLAISDGR